MEHYKTCTKCKQAVKIELFSYRKAAKDKLNSWCKPCIAENAMRIRTANPEASRQANRLHYKHNGDRRRTAAQKWRKNNKSYLATYQTSWRNKNRSRVNNYSRIHNSIRRARIKSTQNFQITDKDVRTLLNQPCMYCGAKASHLDHIIPISKNGINGIGNLAPACAKCNLSKSDKFVMEWRIWKLKSGF